MDLEEELNKIIRLLKIKQVKASLLIFLTGIIIITSLRDYRPIINIGITSLTIITLYYYHKIQDIKLFITLSIIGLIIEGINLLAGVHVYAHQNIFGVPLYIILGYGIIGLLIRNITIKTAKKPIKKKQITLLAPPALLAQMSIITLLHFNTALTTIMMISLSAFMLYKYKEEKEIKPFIISATAGLIIETALINSVLKAYISSIFPLWIPLVYGTSILIIRRWVLEKPEIINV